MPRKKAYSGKQKKQQLRDKKDRKNQNGTWTDSNKDRIKKINQQPEAKNDANRYRLHFLKESCEEIERRKLFSQTTLIEPVSENDTEVDIQDIYQPGSELDMPHRPSWNHRLSKDAFLKNEEKYFSEYLEQIYSKFEDKSLSYFEHNLETWRQLWRVMEMSDVLCMLTDVRHPVLHFSPALYEYVVTTLKRPLILILNKIDLVPASLVAAWHHYFMQKFPNLRIVCFTSFPKDMRSEEITKRISKRRPVGKRIYTTQIGPKELLNICKDICNGEVDLGDWECKIENDLADIGIVDESTSDADVHSEHLPPSEFVRFKNGRLTIGFLGHPNVGKSSLMNGLIGKKVVSTSVTPGHTKYFQTYFLTRNVMLCDCPGLVFPSLVDKQFQILSGIYPIAQVQEPYTSVGYLAQRLPLITLLQLKHPDGDTKDSKWTAWDICEAWAIKRGFYSARGGKTDVYRAANNILRWTVDGKICLCMKPPGYTETKDEWMNHPETKRLLQLRGIDSSEESTLNRGDVPEQQRTTSYQEMETSLEELYSSTEDEESTEESESEEEVDKPSSNPFDILAEDDGD